MARPVMLRAALAVLTFAVAGAAAADAWQGDGHTGTLHFTAVQAGAKFTGAFTRFEVRFDFDAKDPDRGRLHVTVPTGSVDTSDTDRDEILQGADFFWSEKHPEAVFHAERFERDGKGWRASGELTIRGVTRPAAVRFTLAPATKRLAMKGTANLRRLEFGVGRGEWESTEWIGDEVGVLFDLKLQPAAANPSS